MTAAKRQRPVFLEPWLPPRTSTDPDGGSLWSIDLGNAVTVYLDRTNHIVISGGPHPLDVLTARRVHEALGAAIQQATIPDEWLAL